MTIEAFKQLNHEQKLRTIRYSGNILGPYERYNENGGGRVPGDIYGIEDFFVYLSEDEKIIVPSRRNPLPPPEEEEEEATEPEQA